MDIQAATNQSEKKKRTPREISPTSRTIPFNRACKEFGVSYKTGRDAVFAGELPVIRLGTGRNWTVRRDAFEAWLRAKEERFVPTEHRWIASR
jgi:excisionase family DNA binding protein